MNDKYALRNKAVSFAGPFIMDGTAFLLLTAIPLLALRCNANTLFMGMIGWVPQACRFPCCFFTGRLSDKVGRLQVLIPALILAFTACVLCTRVNSPTMLLLVLCAFMVANGGFYPTFQASIGDRSRSGELRKNLAFFNGGVTLGGSACAVLSAYLLTMGRNIPFIVAAVMMVILLSVIVRWLRSPIQHHEAESTSTETDGGGPGIMLPIARMGLFVLYMGYSMGRFVFPDLASRLGMGEHMIGVVAAMVLVGQGCGVLLANVGPWWKGKMWPLIVVQCTAIVSGVLVSAAASPQAFGAAFFLLGMCLGVNYTAALYYGMQLRTNMGRNTSIHESLISGGVIIGSLLGAAIAQYISSKMPYMFFSICMLLALAVSVSIILKENRQREESPEGIIDRGTGDV